MKLLNATYLTSLLALVSIGAASATTIGTVASPTHPLTASFTGGSAGKLTISSVHVSFDGVNSILTFSPLTATSPTPIEGLTGGTFSITSGATTLLTGGFGAGDLLAATGSQSVLFLSNDVTYTGGTKLALAGLNPGDPGSFSLSLSDSVHSTAHPNQGVLIDPTTHYIDNFTSHGIGGTFSGIHITTAVPEPGSVAALMIGGMFLLGAVLRRRTGASTIAA